MPKILTSWKEIAQYLGKGVRTVQRWEREAGLPVRRQTASSPHAVMAMTDELDGWARSRTRGPSGALAGALQREMTLLHAENNELRARLVVLEAAFGAMLTAGETAGDTHLPVSARNREAGPSFLRFERRLLPAPTLLCPLIAAPERQALREAAQQIRAQTVRTRLSLAFLWCEIASRREANRSPAALQRARHSAVRIERSLDEPGYVPLHERDELRTRVRELRLRIECIARNSGCDPGLLRSQSLSTRGPSINLGC